MVGPLVTACARCGCGCRSQEPSAASSALVTALRSWAAERGVVAPRHVPAPSAHGWRSRAKLAVGPWQPGSRGRGPSLGLFEVGTRRVLPTADCLAHDLSIRRAVPVLEQVFEELQIKPFDHEDPSVQPPSRLRYVQLTTERSTGLLQLVLVWNGSSAEEVPEAADVATRLWELPGADRAPSSSSWAPLPAGGSRLPAQLWHSIWSHFRGQGEGEEASSSIFARSHNQGSGQEDPAWLLHFGEPTILEQIDGLPFRFGPGVFRQPHLDLFERIVRDAKSATRRWAKQERRTSSPLELLELCGGVGILGLSLAAATSASPSYLRAAAATGATTAATTVSTAAATRATTSASPPGSPSPLVGDAAWQVLTTDLNPHCRPLFFDNAAAIFGPLHQCSFLAADLHEAARLSSSLSSSASTPASSSTSASTLATTSASASVPDLAVAERRSRSIAKSNSNSKANSSKARRAAGSVAAFDDINSNSNSNIRNINKSSSNSKSQSATGSVDAFALERSVVVADPPRKGLGEAVIKELAAAQSLRLFLYLSCGFEAFCKDAEALLLHGFKVSELRSYDSFPGTKHIEILAVFTKSPTTSAVSHWLRPALAGSNRATTTSRHRKTPQSGHSR